MTPTDETPNEPGQPDDPAEEPTAPEPPAEEPSAPDPVEEPAAPEPVEEPTAPEPPVEDPVAEAPVEPDAEAPAEETPIDDSTIEEPAETPAAEQPSEDAEPTVPEATEEAAEAPAAETPAERPARTAAETEPKAKDVVPGANLEPIAITTERELTAEERARLEAEEEERLSREAAAQDDDDDDELPRRAAVAVPADASIQATGKRKSSVARVLLSSGGGQFEINGKGLEEYFPRPHHQSMARQPLITAGYDGNVDLRIRVHGGGISGQAGAVRHGIARALVELDPELRGDLKKRGLLTRDAREKERRKAGLKKARKRPQFSKR